MSQTLDAVVLRNACNLLASDQRWTSGAWARDARGNRCSPLSRYAIQWCAVGALEKCAYDLVGNEQSARQLADAIGKDLVPATGGLVFVNERGGYALVRTVMAMGGPPRNAGPTWPFANFRTRQGFAAFVRSNRSHVEPCRPAAEAQEAVMEPA